MSEHVITFEAYEKLKEELNFLSTTNRKEIAERIQKAKDLGDLSENAEYSQAKEDQAFNDGRIAEIQNILKNATIADSAKAGKVGLGSIVKVKVLNKEKELQIVSFNESDPLSGKISNESPIGQALLNKKKGDMIEVNTPSGKIAYEILGIK